MKDNYPTRLRSQSNFIDRNEPTVYFHPDYLDKEQIDFYTENGYLLLKDFFTSLPEINELEVGLVTMEPFVNEKRSITGVHNKEPFKSMSASPKLTEIVKPILGSDIYIHQSRINFKMPFISSGWHWHSDFETWHAQDGMPGMRCLSVMIPLTSNTDLNGPLLVIPGSHKVFWSSAKSEKTFSAQDNFADQKEGVPDIAALQKFIELSNGRIDKILCEPGDIVLFDCNIIHGSVANMTPLPRTNLFFVYNSIENLLTNPFSSEEHRPEEMGTTKNIEVL